MSKPVNMNVWRDRPKSVLVKEIMSSFDISLPEIAKAFGTTVSLEELYPEDAASVDKVKGVRDKYLQLKSELAEMKKLYGFKD